MIADLKGNCEANLPLTVLELPSKLGDEREEKERSTLEIDEMVDIARMVLKDELHHHLKCRGALLRQLPLQLAHDPVLHVQDLPEQRLLQ